MITGRGEGYFSEIFYDLILLKMKHIKQYIWALLLFTLVFVIASCSQAKEPTITGYMLTASELGQVLELDEAGDISRRISAENTYDVTKLANGNVLYAHHKGVKIVSPEGEEVFTYKSESEIFACQLLSDDKILVGECTAGQLLEMNLKGEISKRISLTYKKGGHGCLRNARKIDDGHYLACHYGDKTVREYDDRGNVLKEFVRPYNVYQAQRLDDGSTIISDKYCMSIYDTKDVMIWEFDAREYPSLGVNHLAGFEVLPNGEILICNWLGHHPYKEGVPLFKINREKEILWKYTNAEQTYSCTNVQVLF